jgi:DNA-binding MurR/RpiR family transcriptional regulator
MDIPGTYWGDIRDRRRGAKMMTLGSNLNARISQNIDKFTPSDQLIADYLIGGYPNSLLSNATEIAANLDLTVSTVTRFFPKIGYKSAKLAMAEFREEFQFIASSPLDRVAKGDREGPEEKNSFQAVLDQDYSNIRSTFDSINQETVNKFLDLIADNKRTIFVLGNRKEHSLAYYFYYQMVNVRKNVTLLEPSNIVDQVSRMKERDLLVIFEFRRYSKIHETAARYAKDIGAVNVVITDSPIAPTARFTNCLFLVSTIGRAAFDSYTAALSLINALFASLLDNSSNLVTERYQVLEDLFERFDTFSCQKKSPKTNEGG